MPKQAGEDGTTAGHLPVETPRGAARPAGFGHSRRRFTPIEYRLGLVTALLAALAAVLFVLNGLANGWSTAFDLALTIVSPFDRGRVRAPAVAAPLSVVGWLLVPALVGALAGFAVARTTGVRPPPVPLDRSAGPVADPPAPSWTAAGSSGTERHRAGRVERGTEADRSASRWREEPAPPPAAGYQYGARGREIVAEAQRAAELAQTLGELLAVTPTPGPADTDIVRQITGRAEVALRIAEELAIAGPTGTAGATGTAGPGALSTSGEAGRRGGSQLARELATLEHLVARVPVQTPEVNRVCAALTQHLRRFRVQVEGLGAR